MQRDYTSFLQKIYRLDQKISKLQDNAIFLNLHAHVDRDPKFLRQKLDTKIESLFCRFYNAQKNRRIKEKNIEEKVNQINNSERASIVY